MTKKLYYLFLLLFIPTTTFSQINTFPYNELFDSGAAGWIVQTISGTAWELGSPTAAGTVGAYSTPNCWGTDLDSGYRANSLTYLKSPKFYIGSMSNPYFSFLQFRYMSQGMDGMFLQYSTDDISWQLMGYYNCPFASNWYNTTSVYSTGQAAFTGNSNGWTQSGIYLNGLGQNDSIRIRFVFNSNLLFGSAQPGAFIDNVGLYENVIFQQDLNTLSFVNPSGNIAPGNTNPIDVLVRNASTVAIDTFTCGIKLGTSYSTTQVIQHIEAGAFDTVHIGTISFPPGQTTLCAFATLPGDVNHANDTICKSFVTSAALPYNQDFELSDGGWYNSSMQPTNWEYGTPNYGQTSGAHSGIKCWDVNLDTSYFNSAISYLYTPTFDFTTIGASQLSFFINYDTENYYDGTRLEYTTDGGASWQILGSINDPLATSWYNIAFLNSSGFPAWQSISLGWQNAKYNLTFLQSYNSVQFRFVFTSDNTAVTDGVSIDDFSIQPLPAVEPALVHFSCANYNIPLGQTSYPILFTVKNQGSQTLTSINFGYTINGLSGATNTYNGNILPGDSVVVSLPGIVVNSSTTLICGFIQKSGDVDTTNNSSCFILNGVALMSLPYYENFDNGNSGWVADNSLSVGTAWELGNPSFGTTTGTLSGNYAWDINLTSSYGPDAINYLYTPLFDITSVLHPKLSFYQNRNTETGWDGMRVEYSYDSQNWSLLGGFGYPNTVNWYNEQMINSSQLPAWADMSLGWEYSEILLDNYQNGQFIQFRFVFTSDPSIVRDGITIDNFAVTAAFDNDASLEAITSPGTYMVEGAASPFIISVKNKGVNTLTQLNLTYILNNGTPQTFNWSGSLLSDSTMSLNIGFITPVGGNNSIKIYNTWLSDMDHYNDTLTINPYAIYAQDAGVNTILSPVNNTASGSSQLVSVYLKNDGAYTLTSIPVTMQLNNEPPVSSTWTGNLNPGAITYFSMPNLIAAVDTNHLKVYIDWPTDIHHENDTAYSTYYGYLSATLPYSTDFETPNGGWRNETSSQFTEWQYGTPNFGVTNTTHSGSKCWDINLNTPYFSAALASLITPYFIVNPGASLKLDFWTNYSTESNADGLYIEYSSDEINWTHLGIVNDPQGNNWYNSTLTSSKPGWSGFSQGWKNCSYTFTPIISSNYIIFRYRFISDINVVDAGVSVDDVNLSVVTGIEDQISANKLKIYPNPAKDFLQIYCPKDCLNETVVIKNTLGQSIYQKKMISDEFRIDINNLSPGIYYLSTGKNLQTSIKFIKQ